MRSFWRSAKRYRSESSTFLGPIASVFGRRLFHAACALSRWYHGIFFSAVSARWLCVLCHSYGVSKNLNSSRQNHSFHLAKTNENFPSRRCKQMTPTSESYLKFKYVPQLISPTSVSFGLTVFTASSIPVFTYVAQIAFSKNCADPLPCQHRICFCTTEQTHYSKVANLFQQFGDNLAAEHSQCVFTLWRLDVQVTVF